MWIGVDWNIRMKWGSRAAEAIPFLRPAIPLSWARTGLDEAKNRVHLWTMQIKLKALQLTNVN